MNELADMLTRHEGVRLKPYLDTVGKLTIGIGRNLDDVGISGYEAAYLLENDITKARNELRKAFPWFPNLTCQRQDALTDMCFNVGLPRLQGFTKMIAAMERQDYETAAVEMLDSKWATQVGERATELAAIIRTGMFQI